MRRLPVSMALLLIASTIAAFSPPTASADTWQAKKGLNCGVGGTQGPCISSGPGCGRSLPPGQCLFPKANAEALCRAHPQCVAVTCYGASCFARQNANFVTDATATSIAVAKGPPPATKIPASSTPTAPLFKTPAAPVGRPVPAPRPTSRPAPPKTSKVLRDHLAAVAAKIRKDLPAELAKNIEAVSAATRCASGCDQPGSQAIVVGAKVTDFNSLTMPANFHKPRVSTLPKELCELPEMKAQIFAWGIGLVIDLVDQGNQKLEKIDITARSCGFAPQQQPIKDGFFSIRSERGCLDVENKSRIDGAIIVSAACDQSASQVFQFRSAGKNAAGQEIWMLVNNQSKLCLTLAGNPAQPGTVLQQSACENKLDQWFRWLSEDAPFNQISTSGSLNLDVTFGASHRFAVTQQPAFKKTQQYFQAFPSTVKVVGGGLPGPIPPVLPPAGTPPGGVNPPVTPPPPTPPKLGRPIDEIKAEQEKIAREAREKAAAEQRKRDSAIAHAQKAADLSPQQRAAQARAALRDWATDLGNDGYHSSSSRSASGQLDNGTERRESLGTFHAGSHYVLAARCDQGCLDLDIVLFDASGEEVVSDTRTDAGATVAVKPPSDQIYSVVISMASCLAEPCHWELRTQRKWLMRDKLRELSAEAEKDGFTRARSVSNKDDSLAEGEKTQVSIGSLNTGNTYLISALCDDDCDDLDLALLDANGNEVAADRQGDNNPIVEIKPPKLGSYTAVIEMPSCGAENCHWGMQVFRKALQDEAAKQAKLREVEGAARDAENELGRDGFTRVLSHQDRELIEGASMKVPLGAFQSGKTYRVLGVCDDSCRSFLVEVIDTRGAVVDGDDGAFPDIELVQSSTRTFSANVTMAQCSDDPCKFRVFVMQAP